jgi:hypothetical protein
LKCEDKSKSNGTFAKKKDIYHKFTKTKLILLFKVILLDFESRGSSVSKVFLVLSRKNKVLVASLTNFAPRQFLERIVTADET